MGSLKAVDTYYIDVHADPPRSTYSHDSPMALALEVITYVDLIKLEPAQPL